VADIKTLVINAVNKLISKKTDSDVTESSTNPVASSGIKTYVDSSIESNLTTFKESLADVAKLGTFESLTNKPTTLSGYGITDAKISNGTITIGKNSLTPATSLSWSAITGKPTTLMGYGVTNYINLGGAVSSTTTSLNNSGTVTVNVNNLYESYLTWGGKNWSGNFGALDASLIPDLGANRFAFLPPSAVTIEYSRDGGTTWIDYGASDDIKRALFGSKEASNIVIGGTNSGVTTDYQVRLTINTAGNVYSDLKKFVIFISTRGAKGCYCTFSAATHGDPDNFEVFQDKVGISGWSGYNVINQSITTYGYYDSQYQYLRFTFGITGLHTDTSYNNALTIYSIMAFGGVGWSTPSTMARTGHLYYYDYNQNATFPQAVTATKLIKSGGTSSQFLKADGSVDSNTYQARGKYVTYTSSSGVAFGAKTNQTTYCYGQSPMVVSGGIIIGGTAASAGLVTRGVCGVTPPDTTTGACTKSQLYINYDGDNAYTRSLVLGADGEGVAITTSTATSTIATSAMGKTKSAIRGDQMVNYVTAKIAGLAQSSSLAAVATSGSYNDLLNKPESNQTTIETETFTVTDASTIPTFTLTNVVAVVVFVNSVLARDGEEYGITGGTTLTFSSTLPVGTEITIYKFVTVGSVIPTPTYSIDSVLSTTSTNAVQNKVITASINALQNSIDTAYAKYVAELG
jgi:hypothetical protein